MGIGPGRVIVELLKAGTAFWALYLMYRLGDASRDDARLLFAICIAVAGVRLLVKLIDQTVGVDR